MMALRKKLNNVTLDVSQFRPEELSVDLQGHTLVIRGQHAERAEEGGTVERYFVRKYILPEYIKEDDIKSNLEENGTLSVTFAKDEAELPSKKIPIQVDPNWKPQPSKALIVRSPIPLWWF